MAAFQRLLNARAIQKEEKPNYEHEAKLQAVQYSHSPPVPTKDQQEQRQIRSKFSDVDLQAYHGRPQPVRSNTESLLQAPNGMDSNGYDSNPTSMYEDDSPAMSPAFQRHLALRPLQTQMPPQGQPHDHHENSKPRRRSRSATNDSNAPGGGIWENYNKDRRNHPRQDSLQGPSKSSSAGSLQHKRDHQRSRTPTPENKSRFDPLSHIGSTTKVAHNLSGSDGSPTDSAGNSISDENGTPRKGGRKRSRDLDYSFDALSSMDYKRLKDESFDHFPEHANIVSQHNLPDAKLPLSDRLHWVYSDKTHKDKGARARGFFASLTIDQYEECGDLLLDGFRDVMDRLRQARQQKRKAVKIMEEQIAKREAWVSRKRLVLDQDLGRLKNAGTAVVKPVKAR